MVLVSSCGVGTGGRADGQAQRVNDEDFFDAYELLLRDIPGQQGEYPEYLRGSFADEGQETAVSQAEYPVSSEPRVLFAESMVLDPGEQQAFALEGVAPGWYSISFRYRRSDALLANSSLSLSIDGRLPFREAGQLELPRYWQDVSKEFSRDRYGDESLPAQRPIGDWVEGSLYDVSGRSTEPLYFYLDSGADELLLRNNGGQALQLSKLSLYPRIQLPSYEEYRNSLASAQADATAQSGQSADVYVDAISYSAKNAYDVRLGSVRNPDLAPYDPVDRLLNIVDGSSWEQSGEEVYYQVEIPHSGWYRIRLHYQNPKSDFSVFRSLRIDGTIPFTAARALELPATGSRWSHSVLSDPETGEPFLFYLEEGTRTISFRSEIEALSQAVRSLKTIIAHMNFFGIEIMKVTGRDIDEDRSWRLTEYLPLTESYLEAYTLLIRRIIQDLSPYSSRGERSAVLASLYTALFKLELRAEEPDELPVHLEDIYSTSIYDRPVTQILGDTITELENSSLHLDSFYLDAGEVAPLPRRAGLIKRAYGGLASLWSTFVSDKYVTRNSEEELNVWVTRPLTHIDLMQKMVDAEFTAKTGIRVKISTMPEPNRLILAAAADRTPDIAMGLPSYIPFDLAIRSATLDLSSFEDFWSFASDFAPGAFIPYVLNEGVYGMPETLDFHALVYRTDIFNQLGLTPPDTWQQVIEQLPVLNRYGMNFYHPVAGGLPTLKWFYQTSPFVYQYGGRLYSEDGLSVTLAEPATVEALRFQAELFSLYALQEQVPSFYNSFRFGVIPVGIVDSQTYLQLKYAAPELKGQWALAPYPGVPDDNGNPRRWFIANGVSAVIMKDSQRHEDSWEFLKWWLSTPTQADFGYRLQSTYGPEFLWISANLDALGEAPIEAAEKEVILEQVRWLRDVPRTPAQYMLERGLSDIWINSATRGRPIRTEIDRMIPVIEREVSRKMIEFGFINAQGDVLEPFIVPDIDWVEEKFDLHRAGGNPAYGEDAQ